MASNLKTAGVPISRRGLLAIPLGLLLCGTLVFAGPIRWDQYHLDAARQALAAFDPKRAEHHLDRCLGWWTGLFEIRLLSAQAAREREEYTAATAHLDACERLEPKSSDLLLERSLLSAELGETQRAENLLKSRFGADPARAAALHVAVGHGHLRNHQPVEAAWCAEQALGLQPDDARALDVRGRSRELLDKHEDALADFQRVFELAPEHGSVRLRLAEMHYQTGRPLEAAVHFETLRPQQPDHADILFGLARCRLDLAEEEEARRLLEALLQQRPDHRGGLLERGRLALRGGRLAEAEKCLSGLTSLAPGDLDAQLFLRTCLEKLGKDEAAGTCSARILTLERETTRVSRALARAVQQAPSADEFVELGSALIALNREREALALFSNALRANPRHRGAHTRLAEYYRGAGRHEQARRHAEQAAPVSRGS